MATSEGGRAVSGSSDKWRVARGLVHGKWSVRAPGLRFIFF